MRMRSVGAAVGLRVGLGVGLVVGAVVGLVLSVLMGLVVGAVVGVVVGLLVELGVGLIMGAVVGAALVGLLVGVDVGLDVASTSAGHVSCSWGCGCGLCGGSDRKTSFNIAGISIVHVPLGRQCSCSSCYIYRRAYRDSHSMCIGRRTRLCNPGASIGGVRRAKGNGCTTSRLLTIRIRGILQVVVLATRFQTATTCIPGRGGRNKGSIQRIQAVVARIA